MKKLFNKVTFLSILLSLISIFPVFGLIYLFAYLTDKGSFFGPGLGAYAITIIYGIPVIIIVTTIIIIGKFGKKGILSAIGYLILVVGVPFTIWEIVNFPKQIEAYRVKKETTLADNEFFEDAKEVINKPYATTYLESAIYYRDNQILYITDPKATYSEGIRYHYGDRIIDEELTNYITIFYNNRDNFSYLVAKQEDKTLYAINIEGYGTFKINKGVAYEFTKDLNRQILNYGTDAQIAKDEPWRMLDDEFEIHNFPLQKIAIEDNYVTIPSTLISNYRLPIFEDDNTINQVRTAEKITDYADYSINLVVENSEATYNAGSPFKYTSNTIGIPDDLNRIHILPSNNGATKLQAYLMIYYIAFEGNGEYTRISNIIEFTR